MTTLYEYFDLNFCISTKTNINDISAMYNYFSSTCYQHAPYRLNNRSICAYEPIAHRRIYPSHNLAKRFRVFSLLCQVISSVYVTEVIWNDKTANVNLCLSQTTNASQFGGSVLQQSLLPQQPQTLCNHSVHLDTTIIVTVVWDDRGCQLVPIVRTTSQPPCHKFKSLRRI